ncbi:PrsW family intramembrane metalloprotease [Bacillus sp. M6-12]|uniref:glutamic-type intramembrane protease PrsW n=1 Tax=Bacillus sp. M6-12 TaxID=2054166 RepID=UPI000C763FF9|nr:glutamic-type intramembrane protease PrsW [Bacillus sp. M6-12]PLS16372.1 PrsW family intramembrane metalloprotease [Bacillus sp. M6-12]
MLVILTAGLAPGLALLSYFYLKDQIETEPLSVVGRAFLFGAFLVFPLMFIQYVMETENVFDSNLASAFIQSGLLEEFFKWFILFYAIYNHADFDEPYDGIVYGAAVSLGFATLENVLYLVANGVEHAFGRAVLPVSSHALFGVIMGYYLGKGKFSSQGMKKKFLLLAFIIPVLLHGTYDFILLTQEFWLYMILPFMIFLWWLGLNKVKRAKILSEYHAASN